jgi:hypothetical protein
MVVCLLRLGREALVVLHGQHLLSWELGVNPTRVLLILLLSKLFLCEMELSLLVFGVSKE